VIAQACLIIVRPLVIFLAWVPSCEEDNSPRHRKRAGATIPSLAKRSSAAPSRCSGQAPSLGSGQVLKDGATRLGVGSFVRKQQLPTAQKTRCGRYRSVES
jgi:hypothetical protein